MYNEKIRIRDVLKFAAEGALLCGVFYVLYLTLVVSCVAIHGNACS